MLCCPILERFSRPLHFSPGSSRSSACPMHRHFGKGVLAAVSPEVGNPRIPRRRKRRPLGGVRLVHRLIQRIVVEIAVERVGADVALIHVARKLNFSHTVPRQEVERGREIRRLVRNRVDRAIVGPQQPLLLKAVSDERVVGVKGGQSEAGVGVLPSQPSEELAHIGRRVLPPSVLEEQVGGAVPAQPLGIGAAGFELSDLASEAAAGEGDLGMVAARARLWSAGRALRRECSARTAGSSRASELLPKRRISG